MGGLKGFKFSTLHCPKCRLKLTRRYLKVLLVVGAAAIMIAYYYYFPEVETHLTVLGSLMALVDPTDEVVA